MIKADFEQGMESVSEFKINIAHFMPQQRWPYHVGYYFQSLS